jgi:integrase
MEVNITRRIDTLEGRRFCPVIFSPNGRIKPDWVLIDGRQERHPKGSYYLDWTEDGQRRRMAVGSDATAAYNCLKKKQSEFDAIAQGLVVTDPIEEEDTRLRLRAAKAEFLDDIQLSRQRKTWLGYCLSLSYFTQCCSKTYLEEIERKDLLRFVVFLRDEKELAPRTVHNKFAEVLTFLAAQGVPKLVSKNDRPRFVDQEVEIYEDHELLTLHSVCSLYHSTQYDFYLMSGFREQETMHVQWENIRFNSNVVEMRWKPLARWMPKAYKEREVPVPTLLLDRLDNYRRTLPASRASDKALVFSTANGTRDTHMLRALKRNAKKSCQDQDGFWLHKFRATFATTHLQAGVDLRTVMTWMGQTNLETIIRYLRYSNGLEVELVGGWYEAGRPFSAGFEICGNGAELKLEAGQLRLIASGKDQLVETPAEEEYTEQMRYFIECCEKQIAPELCPPAESAEAVRIANLLRASRDGNGKELSC